MVLFYADGDGAGIAAGDTVCDIWRDAGVQAWNVICSSGMDPAADWSERVERSGWLANSEVLRRVDYKE